MEDLQRVWHRSLLQQADPHNDSYYGEIAWGRLRVNTSAREEGGGGSMRGAPAWSTRLALESALAKWKPSANVLIRAQDAMLGAIDMLPGA